ncbi:TIGR04282 family arsenosugar biosynthesis glycosyltransferase [Niastella populi]|uniref:Glycosyltransferase n=1 Tax=Niastella populi TaxID=550983 RepID=A0A1V9FPH0_9BACT|nr:TIGR04282 family arsenosugar biosynthesis glycosyltransferase [Niastella populi]OQP60242.1 glycosyltransferase [Niastella populi]
MMKQALLIFARNLVYGQVKTRLAATIGRQRALAVYELLLEHTVAVTERLPFDKVVFYSEKIDGGDIWNDRSYKKQVQAGNDLGERMRHAFATVFGKGYQKAAIIGTDCFELTTLIITEAFECLDKYDVVIGPAKDGGYYLLGMKKLYPGLFNDIQWSTDQVLKQTLAACEQLQISTHLLPALSDIDHEEDLKNIHI